jgi:hypothetical protein
MSSTVLFTSVRVLRQSLGEQRSRPLDRRWFGPGPGRCAEGLYLAAAADRNDVFHRFPDRRRVIC